MDCLCYSRSSLCDILAYFFAASAGRPKSKAAVTLAGKLQELYNTVRDFTDSHGRTLSTPFMKLPPKSVSFLFSLFSCLFPSPYLIFPFIWTHSFHFPGAVEQCCRTSRQRRHWLFRKRVKTDCFNHSRHKNWQCVFYFCQVGHS